MRDSHAAINLVGILAEGGAQKFDAVQGAGAGAVAKAANAVGARMVHVSAIGADENSPSRYGRPRPPAKGGARGRTIGDDPAALGGVRSRG